MWLRDSRSVQTIPLSETDLDNAAHSPNPFVASIFTPRFLASYIVFHIGYPQWLNKVWSKCKGAMLHPDDVVVEDGTQCQQLGVAQPSALCNPIQHSFVILAQSSFTSRFSYRLRISASFPPFPCAAQAACPSSHVYVDRFLHSHCFRRPGAGSPRLWKLQ